MLTHITIYNSIYKFLHQFDVRLSTSPQKFILNTTLTNVDYLLEYRKPFKTFHMHINFTEILLRSSFRYNNIKKLFFTKIFIKNQLRLTLNYHIMSRDKMNTHSAFKTICDYNERELLRAPIYTLRSIVSYFF